MIEWTVGAAAEQIEAITELVNAELEGIDCPMKARMQIDIAIDELMSNIIFYAYENPEEETVTVRMDVTEDPHAIRITFLDRGVPYNPLEKDDPDVTLSAEERKIGGLGIFMVKKSMDEVLYEYREGQNALTIVKYL